MYICVCVCFYNTESKSERESESEREREWENGVRANEREKVRECLGVSVRKKESDRETE